MKTLTKIILFISMAIGLNSTILSMDNQFNIDDRNPCFQTNKGTLKLFESNLCKQNSISSMALSPCGQIIAIAPLSSVCKVINLNGECLARLVGHNDKIFSVAFSPNGQFIATASADHTIKIWDLNGTCISTLKGHIAEVNSVAFSQDGQYLISTSFNDWSVKIWDLAYAKDTETIISKYGKITAAAFGRLSHIIAVGYNDGMAEIINLKTNKYILLKGHRSAITSIAFSQHGTLIATASAGGTVRVWDLRGNCLVTLIGHKDRINSVTFSPDESTIITASNDGTVKIWNLRNRCLATFEGNKCVVSSAMDNSTGYCIISASPNGTLKLWEPLDHMKQRIIQKNCNETCGICLVTEIKDSQNISLLTCCKQLICSHCLADIKNNALKNEQPVLCPFCRGPID